MALGKTGESAIAYTPFNKTSFGYTTADLTGPHSGLTNVKVIITVKSGTNHWDDTGHISTTGSGSAVASYNSDKLEWSCEGTLADVAGVLDNLDFFPADFPAVRNWSTKAIKPNETTGTFPIYQNVGEEPATDDPIPDTVFDLKVYDADDIGAGATTYEVKFEATQPTFGKQRPYWSTEPTNEDLATTAHGETTGGLIDMGVIAQGSDTDPLTVTCEFRDFDSTSPHSGSAYGVFASSRSSKIFIGDKKPGSTGTGSNRINFTGTKAEVQAYLDNIRYWRCVGATTLHIPSTFVPNYDAFDMYFTISNGPVGVEYTKHVYFSDATIGLTTIPSQPSFDEDTALALDFSCSTSDVPSDVDTYTTTVTLNGTGNTGVDTFGTSTSFNASQYGVGFTETFDSTTGVLSISHSGTSNDDKIMLALRNLVFTPEADFNSAFSMTVDLTYTGSVNGSSYTSTQQTVSIASGGAYAEVGNQNITHTWTEDTVYGFSVGGAGGNPQIIHPGNDNWSMALTLSDAAAGSLNVPSPTSTYGTMTPSAGGVYTLTGTKTQVNTGLLNMQLIPAADYDTSFTIGFAAERTSGNLEHNSTEYGTYTMTATAVGEYSITQATNLAWEEDVNMTYDSGLAITDTAADASLPAAGSDYRLEIAMWLYTGGAWVEFTDGTMVTNTTTNLVKAGAGNENGQGDTNMISYTGPKADINTALTTLRFIPTVDYSGLGPSVYYKLVRVSDSAVLLTQGNSTESKLATGTAHDEYSYTHTSDVDWDEDTPELFDSGVQITDKADENGDYSQHESDYTVTLQPLEWDLPYDALTTATFNVLTTITGYSNLTIAVNSNVTTISGPKTDVNTALQNLKMIPDLDWTASSSDDGNFFSYIDITRDSDSEPILDGSAVVGGGGVWIGFNEGTESDEYYTSVTGMTYLEDTPKTIFDGLDVGVSEEADQSTSGITYVVTLTLSDSGAGEWTGTGSHTKTLSADTRTSINASIQALEFTPTLDYSSDFNILYSQTRYINGGSAATHATNENIGTVDGTASPFGDYYTGITGMTYLEDTPKTIFDGLDVGITDVAGDNLSGITYEVIVKLSDSGAGEWTGTGSHIKTLSADTKTSINAALQALEFTPTMDYSTDFNILYSQDRYVDSVVDPTHQYSDVNIGTVDATASPLGDYYTSVTGMTYLEDTPKTIFDGLDVGITDIAPDNYSNITYEVTLSLSDDGTTAANTAGEWTGTGSHIKVLTGTKASVNAALQALEFTPTMDYSSDPYILYTQKRYISGSLNMTHATLESLGQVTGTASPLGDYYTGITGMTYTEDIPSQSIFSGHDIGVTDIAQDNYSDITYEVTVTIPSAAGTFDTNSSSTYTITDTKANVNTALENLAFSPATADYTANFNITYTQKRYVSAANPETHADAVNVGTVVNIPVAEFTYGTGNSNIQYMVPDGTLPNSFSQILSPKKLTQNWSKTYSTPFTITDTWEDGGASQYKIVFTVPSGTTLYDNTNTSFAGTFDWDTKANLHTKLSEGIRISGATASLSLAFELFRKTATNTEASLGTGSLTYTFLATPVFQQVVYDYNDFGTINNSRTISNGETMYGMGGSSNGTNVNSDIDMYTNWDSTHWTSVSFSNLGSYLTWVDNTTSRGLKISSSLTSSTVITTDVTIITKYGTKTTYSNIKLNQTSIGTSPYTIVDGQIQATNRPALLSQGDNTNSPMLMHQSNYWDGTYMQLGQQAVELDGTLLHYTNDISDRFEDEFDDSVSGEYEGWLSGYNRAIVSGPQGYFYGFKVDRNSTSGDVQINLVSKTTPSGIWVPGSGNQMPTLTIKSSYSTWGTSTGWDQFCYVQDIKYDSSNENIYALCILNTPGSNSYAIIAKLNYDGSATGMGSHTAYSWSIVKEIQLLDSTDHYFLEAYLSNDFETVVCMQTETDGVYTWYDETNSTNRLRIYDKDQGGTDTWGLVTTKTYSGPTESPTNEEYELRHYGTQKNNFWHDVNYCAYNGVDTFITADGYKVYKKDQGGANAWGEVTTDLYVWKDENYEYLNAYGIYKFTKDYLFLATNLYCQIFDKSTLLPITPAYKDYGNNDDWGSSVRTPGPSSRYTWSSSSGYNYGYTPFGNAGPLSHPVVEASLEHNVIGVQHYQDEIEYDDTLLDPFVYTKDGEIIFKLYKIET